MFVFVPNNIRNGLQHLARFSGYVSCTLMRMRASEVGFLYQLSRITGRSSTWLLFTVSKLLICCAILAMIMVKYRQPGLWDNDHRPTILVTCYEVRSLQLIFGHPYPDSKVHGANMGPIWVLSAPDGPHVGPMNFAIRVCLICECSSFKWVALTQLKEI